MPDRRSEEPEVPSGSAAYLEDTISPAKIEKLNGPFADSPGKPEDPLEQGIPRRQTVIAAPDELRLPRE